MKSDLLKNMLLIEEPSALKLYHEMMSIAGYFVAPVFLIALVLEFFGELKFGEVVKKLMIVTLFMTFFYQFHTQAVSIALESASETLQKVSPRNIFIKKWHEVKLRTREKKDWGLMERFAVPNVNDLVATAFFMLAKVFVWVLKLIYSTVYHFTYIFSGITAVLYFLGWTKDALKGTVQGSLWCMLLPFVVIAILALVGNSFEDAALSSELVVAKIDTLVWLFGVTLLLLLSPLITFGMIRGEGMQSFGAKMGTMVTNSGMKAASMLPLLALMPQRAKSAVQKIKNTGQAIRQGAGKATRTMQSSSVSESSPPSYLEKSVGRGNVSAETLKSPPPLATRSIAPSQGNPSSQNVTQKQSERSNQSERGIHSQGHSNRGTHAGRIATTQHTQANRGEKEFSKPQSPQVSRMVESQNKQSHSSEQVKSFPRSTVPKSPRLMRRNNELR
jgi:hypothetical protein